MWSGATDEKSTLEDCCQQNLAANGTMGLEYVYNAVHIILPPSISSDSAIHTDVLHSIVSSIFEFGVGTRSRHLSVVNTLPHHLTWQAQNFCLHWNKTPHIPHFHLLIVKCCILIVNCNSPLDLGKGAEKKSVFLMVFLRIKKFTPIFFGNWIYDCQTNFTLGPIEISIFFVQL